jgi:hypothetical protein
MQAESRWLIAWVITSAAVCVGLNLWTRLPVLDLSPGHLIISGMFGLIVTAVCFVLLQSVFLIATIFRWWRSRRSGLGLFILRNRTAGPR